MRFSTYYSSDNSFSRDASRGYPSFRLSTAANRLQQQSNPLVLSIFVLATIAFFVPAAYAVSDRVYDIWRGACATVSVTSILLYLTNCRIGRRWVAFVGCFSMYFIVATVLLNSSGSLLTVFYQFTVCVGFVSFLEYGFVRYGRLFLKALIIAGTAMFLIYLITVLLYHDVPGGMRGEYFNLYSNRVVRGSSWFFFGTDNSSIFDFLPIMASAWFYAFEIDRRFMLFATAVSALMLIVYIWLWSVAAMVSIVLFNLGIMLLMLWNKNRLRNGAFERIVNYRTALLIGIAICGLSIVFVSSDILLLVSSWFGKPLDISRGLMWNNSITTISENMIIGVGIENMQDSYSRLVVRDHCHNIILQLAYCGGLPALGLYFYAVLVCGFPKNLKKYSPGMGVVGLFVLCYLVVATFDWYITIPFPIIVFYIAAFSDSLRKDLVPVG